MKPFQLLRWKLSSCCGHEFGYESTHEGMRTGAPRRDFLKSAAASVAGLSALAALPAGSGAQGRMYPPPPPAASPVSSARWRDRELGSRPAAVFPCPHAAPSPSVAARGPRPRRAARPS